MKKSAHLSMLAVTLFLSITLSATIVFASQNSNEQAKEEARYQAEIEKATPIELGVMSAKQETHSRLYARVGTGLSITETVSGNRGKKIFFWTDIIGRPFIDPNEPFSSDYQFGRLIANSDAVVRGIVPSKRSQITKDDTFLFTDYEVTVSEALKSKRLEGSTITVTSLGGEIISNNVIYKAGGTGRTGIPLLPENKELLLFLKFIPETGSYKLAQYTATFELEDESVRPTGFFLVEETSLQKVRELSAKGP